MSFLFCFMIIFSFGSLPDVEGFISARAWQAEGNPSWLSGDTGKLVTADDDFQLEAQVAMTWEPTSWFSTYLHGLGRLEPDEVEGDAAGIVEAYLKFKGRAGERHGFSSKLGYFFPPTSMENVNALWSSPHTQTLSAINTWIAEEVRLTGLDLSYVFDVSEASRFFVGASVFEGNDTTGALLFWRGWTMSDRLTVWDETLPLPNLTSLTHGGTFYAQNSEGSTPFTSDLDGELGYAARMGFDVRDLFSFQYSYYDNRGDRWLYNNEYAWETDFQTLGFELRPNQHLNLVGEFLDGSTGMGSLESLPAQADFESWYMLTSLHLNQWIVTFRYDSFETTDIDALFDEDNADLNDEEGQAATLSLFREWGRFRVGLEWVELENRRTAILVDGVDHLRDAELLNLELRFFF